MNEIRDPITEWEMSIKKRIVDWSMILVLFAFVCCLVAPLFGPSIKQAKRRAYVMEKNYEELSENDMKGIRPVLNGIAIISWIILLVANLCYWK